MEATNFGERRKNFMETYQNDKILSTTLPELAAKLMYAEFGVNVYDHSYIPIVFTVAWTAILKFMGDEPAEEWKIDVCGVELEYLTEKSESDKSTNIVPQMFHRTLPMFKKNEITPGIGASFTDTMLTNYNNWRSVYALEALTAIENEVYKQLFNEYGIDLMVPAAIYPLVGAAYAAGVQLARETKSTINMYNIFEIDVIQESDKIILTPLAYIKQFLKNDSKK